MKDLPIPNLPSLKFAPFANLEMCEATFEEMGGSLVQGGGEHEFQVSNLENYH